jgi:hypothetical protein
MSRLLDDATTDDEVAELSSLLRVDPSLRSELVDHLLLDTLLDENLGQEPLTALVDLIGESSNPSDLREAEEPTIRTTKNLPVTLENRRWPWMSGWLAVAASITLALSLFSVQGGKEAFASATQLVQAAIHTHAAAIERIYVVDVKQRDATQNREVLPRDVRVSTQGDRFWVEMNGPRRWAWGRDVDGAIWMTLGQQRAVVVGLDEIGTPLRYIGDLYTLQLETLLRNFLKHYRLEKKDGSGGTSIIVATPQRSWSGRPLKRATIEVDQETKAIRKLVVEREFNDQTSSVTTFTLVDSRVSDESRYHPKGHLNESARVFANETSPTRRRELIVNWFGPTSEQWIQIKEPTSNE